MSKTPIRHHAIVRTTHWVNAIALLVMIGSGLRIFNSYPAFARKGATFCCYPFEGHKIPEWLTFGGWLAGARHWHFAAMWVLVVSGYRLFASVFAVAVRSARLTRFQSQSRLRPVRAMRQWIGIALLAPMLVLAVSASSFLGVRCRMSGMVSLDTCCPEGDPGRHAPLQSSVDEPGCCERVVVETAKPIGDAAGDGVSSLGAPMAAVAHVPVASTILLSRVTRVVADRDPPRGSRLSLCLLNRSLLI